MFFGKLFQVFHITKLERKTMEYIHGQSLRTQMINNKKLGFERMITHPCQSGLDIKTSVHINTSKP
jgi:hypothetical protein